MANDPLGGLFYLRPTPLVYTPEDTIGFALLSDLHIGSAMTDYKFLKRELEDASRNGDRILIAGDVVDGIVPADSKRYSPDALHPRIRGKKNILNKVVDWAEEILKPYAHLIDMIGVGNHDAAIEKKHSFDAVEEIVRRLRDEWHHPLYGGYTGLVQYDLVPAGKGKTHTVTLFYHHGSGNGGTLRAAAEAVGKKSGWMTADVYWEGHRHCRFSADEQVVYVENNKVKTKQVRYVMTGAYMRPYNSQSQASFEQHGRMGNYVSDRAMQPHGLGGARLLASFEEKGKPPVLRVLQ